MMIEQKTDCVYIKFVIGPYARFAAISHDVGGVELEPIL